MSEEKSRRRTPYPAEMRADADHGNSPLSIIESPQVIARVR